MSNNITLEILSDYFFNYTERYQPDTERYEIDEFLSEWLVRIQAPSDARGIIRHSAANLGINYLIESTE